MIRLFLHLNKTSQFIIELRQSGFKFKIRSALDVWSIKETFLDLFYERFGTKIGKNWTIIDIGAGIGDFTLFSATQNPHNIVYAFEPDPGSFYLLEENIVLNQITNVHAFQLAVWSKSGELVLDTKLNEPLQYTSHDIESQKILKDQVIVQSVSLQDIFNSCGIKKCQLVKIDCEGGEFEILFNTPESILQNIDRIILEYHDNVTIYNHNDLVNFLSSKGFSVKTHKNYVHSYLGYLNALRLES